MQCDTKWVENFQISSSSIKPLLILLILTFKTKIYITRCFLTTIFISDATHKHSALTDAPVNFIYFLTCSLKIQINEHVFFKCCCRLIISSVVFAISEKKYTNTNRICLNSNWSRFCISQVNTCTYSIQMLETSLLFKKCRRRILWRFFYGFAYEVSFFRIFYNRNCIRHYLFTKHLRHHPL